MIGQNLAIIGAGGHGRVVADCAAAAGWTSISFFDDRYPDSNETAIWPILGNPHTLLNSVPRFDGVIVAIGNGAARLAWHEKLDQAGAVLVNVIHPRSCVSPHAQLGRGVVVAPGAIINIGASISDAAIINTAASVDHDCNIGEAVHVAPGAHMSGNVTIGRLSWIGAGAVIRQGVNIGARTMIGAGAVVVTDLGSDVVAIGCPAKPRK